MSKKSQVALVCVLLITISFSVFVLFNPGTLSSKSPYPLKSCCKPAQHDVHIGCVFKTVMGEDSMDNQMELPIPEQVAKAMERGLIWIRKAQHPDGGWGAGYHHLQNELDPHEVKSDPATTAMVTMALLRTKVAQNDPDYLIALQRGTEYLIQATLNSDPKSDNITSLTSTQPQSKLGANIDVVLTAQFFSNLQDYPQQMPENMERIKKCLDICVAKIENNQDIDGSFKNNGWAGVLQSSFANNALESAEKKGARVNKEVLTKSRDYQKSNINLATGDIKTDRGAGVMLYSVSSTARGSASEAREVKDKVRQAKAKGILKTEDEVNVANLKKIGYSDDQAYKAATAYEVNKLSKQQAQTDAVMSGFGNNGGEEFLSFLQTGEGLIIARDLEWKSWYEKVSAKLLQIQNSDGSWNGHHCITSPVFCTATCILILSVNNDLHSLQQTLVRN